VSEASILARFTKLLTAQRYQTRRPLYVFLWGFLVFKDQDTPESSLTKPKTLKAYTSRPQDTANYELNQKNRVFRSRQLKENNAVLCHHWHRAIRPTWMWEMPFLHGAKSGR